MRIVIPETRYTRKITVEFIKDLWCMGYFHPALGIYIEDNKTYIRFMVASLKPYMAYLRSERH